MKETLLEKKIHLQDNEDILNVVRKHWFIHLTDSLMTLVIGVVPFIVLPFIAPYVPVTPAVAGFVAAVWLLAIWMILFTIWTNYYLDIWIVTDKRIINIDQLHLFKRDVSTLRMERVQDVKVETHGFFATMLGFGNLQVQTAGPEASFYMIEGIANPSEVRNAILHCVDLVTEHRGELVYNKEKNPTWGE